MSSKIEFTELHDRHPGVSPGVSLSYDEAIRVCLDRHHVSPVIFEVSDNGSKSEASIEWQGTDVPTRAAWANKDDATRDGAYGVGLATIELTRGLVAISRAETKTGADYYLAEPGQAAGDLENALRLEVSGTDEGGLSVIKARLAQKLKQAANGDSNLPAIALVVGFAALHVASEDLKNP